MSRYYYCPLDNPPCFYDKKVSEFIPNGSISISDDQYRSLNDGRQSGLSIEINSSGVPVLGRKSELSESQKKSSYSEKLKILKNISENQKLSIENRIGVINDAVEFDDVTPQEIKELSDRKIQLVEWKRFAIDLGRMSYTESLEDHEWPKQPEQGMDLSIS